MTQSTGNDDAKVRAATVLEALAKVLSAREQVANKFQEESAATSRSPNQGQRSAETCCCNPA